MKNNLIGIDLGGTKIEIVILDTNKEIQFRERIPTESEKGPSHIINQILVLYKKAESFINNTFELELVDNIVFPTSPFSLITARSFTTL